MGAPLMGLKSTEAFLATLGITIEKSAKDWLTIYKGKVLVPIAIRHVGERGIKLPYIWNILKKKLIRDGISQNSKEYPEKLKELKRKAFEFI